LCYAEIVADFSDEMFFDLTMPGHSRGRAAGRVAKDTVFSTLASEDTAMRFYVPDEVGSFHSEFMQLAGQGVRV